LASIRLSLIPVVNSSTSVAPFDNKKAFTNSGASLAPMVLDPWMVRRGSAKAAQGIIRQNKKTEIKRKRKKEHELCIQ
jgi:hypothetical protein